MRDFMSAIEEMRQQDRQLDRDVERILVAAPKCPVHGNPFVLGVGIGEEFFAFPSGGCSECFFEKRKEQRNET